MSSSPYLNVSSSRYVVSWSVPEISDLGLGVCCEGCLDSVINYSKST